MPVLATMRGRSRPCRPPSWECSHRGRLGSARPRASRRRPADRGAAPDAGDRVHRGRGPSDRSCVRRVRACPADRAAPAGHRALAPAVEGRHRRPGRRVVEVCGAWTPRSWVPLVTEFFEAGHAQSPFGTRGLLGEGGDARRVNVLVDLTTATTATPSYRRGDGAAGRPRLAEKVANTWSVVPSPTHIPTAALTGIVGPQARGLLAWTLTVPSGTGSPMCIQTSRPTPRRRWTA